jgi:hypothetical protein
MLNKNQKIQNNFTDYIISKSKLYNMENHDNVAQNDEYRIKTFVRILKKKKIKLERKGLYSQKINRDL